MLSDLVAQLLNANQKAVKPPGERGMCPTGCGRPRGVSKKTGALRSYCNECASQRARQYRKNKDAA